MSDGAGLLKEFDFGSNLVVGVLNTRIWPEREPWGLVLEVRSGAG